MGLWQQFFCKHDFVFMYNLYGDEINSWDGNRSLWQCKHCGRIQAREKLHITQVPSLTKRTTPYTEKTCEPTT